MRLSREVSNNSNIQYKEVPKTAKVRIMKVNTRKALGDSGRNRLEKGSPSQLLRTQF